MKIGFIGLGRMGLNMVYNLLDHKQKVVGYNRHPEPTRKAMRKGAEGAFSIKEMIAKLAKPRIVWLMVPAGKPTDAVLTESLRFLKKGDIIIDGGNSFFKDSQRRYKKCQKKGVHFLDCGTSGGMGGARHGACMMIGGDRAVFKKIEPIFRAMCLPKGYGYMGTSGAGHFVKMVHNGIEYGMMGAINEGMEALRKHQPAFGWDMKTVAQVYAHGSIIESRLMSWLYNSFQIKGYLDQISCEVPKGETEEEMAKLEKLAPMPILHEARCMRVNSRKGRGCSQYIAAMRNQFGGHKVKKK